MTNLTWLELTWLVLLFFLPFNRYPRHRSSFSYSLKFSIPSRSMSYNWYKLWISSNLSSSIFNSSWNKKCHKMLPFYETRKYLNFVFVEYRVSLKDKLTRSTRTMYSICSCFLLTFRMTWGSSPRGRPAYVNSCKLEVDFDTWKKNSH